MRVPRTVELLVMTVIVTATHGQVGKQVRCTSSAKCSANQCCLSSLLWNPLPQSWGYCAPRGATGGRCSVVNDQLLDQYKSMVFSNVCPCLDGYLCEGTGVNDDSGYEVGTCVKRCNGKSDCDKNECCAVIDVANNRNKRDSFKGKCSKPGTVGKTCYIIDTVKDEINFLCPCASGLYCRGTGQGRDSCFKGESGTCTNTDHIVMAIPGK